MESNSKDYELHARSNESLRDAMEGSIEENQNTLSTESGDHRSCSSCNGACACNKNVQSME